MSATFHSSWQFSYQRNVEDVESTPQLESWFLLPFPWPWIAWVVWKVTSLHRECLGACSASRHFIYTETRARRPQGDLLLTPSTPKWAAMMTLTSWMTVKGRASPWARWSSWESGSQSSRPEVPCGSAGVVTPAQLTWTQFLNMACPSVQEIWVRRPCPDLHSFSTHLHRGCSGKEPGGKLGVRRGWQPMGSQLSVCSLAKEALSASPHLCAPAWPPCLCLILLPPSGRKGGS